jgi:hypothetical protein
MRTGRESSETRDGLPFILDGMMKPNLDAWLERNGAIALVVAGIVLVTLGLLIPTADAAKVILIVFGACAGILGIMLPRIEGPMKLGPGGLEMLLRKVREKADAFQLPAETRDDVVERTRQSYEDWQRLLWHATSDAAEGKRLNDPSGWTMTGTRLAADAADKIAAEIIANTTTVSCSNCMRIIDERSDIPADERRPCRICGSTARSITVTAPSARGAAS